MNGDFFGFGQHAEAHVERAGGRIDLAGVQLDLGGLDPLNLAVGGHFTIECFDAEGHKKWEETAKNGVTNLALNDILNVYLRNTTQKASWYIGLVDGGVSFSAFAAADYVGSHGGWTENKAYSGSTRPQWSPGAAASQSVSNSSTVDFAMTGTATIKGLFLISDSDNSQELGLIFSTAAFSGGNQGVNNGDTLKITYTVSAASS